MKVHINIDPGIKEDEIIITIKEMNTKVEKILSIINEEESGVIPLQKEERIYLVEPKEVSHVFSRDNKCFAFRGKEEYRYKETLKQFEERYSRYNFIRISKYCLANMDWMEYFEATFGGSLVLVFKNGKKEIVSRKYAKELKKALLKE